MGWRTREKTATSRAVEPKARMVKMAMIMVVCRMARLSFMPSEHLVRVRVRVRRRGRGRGRGRGVKLAEDDDEPEVDEGVPGWGLGAGVGFGGGGVRRR